MNLYKRRRNKYLSKIENNSITIIFGSREKYRNNDVKYKFRQNSNFLYLVGLDEPNAIATIEKTNEKESITTIFSKKISAENTVWESNILGQESILKKYKVEQSYPIENFVDKVTFFLKNKENIYLISENKKYYEKYIRKLLEKKNIKGRNISNANDLLFSDRMIKDIEEILFIKKAHAIAAKAHMDVLQNIKPGIMEYQLESIFIKSCIDLGAKEQAYLPIFASGNNSCILHYNKNEKKLKNNQLILIDAGCEFKYYASDITRTYPINGKFTPEQKAIYEIVLQAQTEGINKCRIGKSWQDINISIIKIISEGLSKLKIIDKSKNYILKNKLYKNFYMHSPGHWIGLDVHDAGYYKKNREWCKFKENMYLTIEPGIYISQQNKSVDKKWRGIGIRIEDNILIKKNGHDVLSRSIPKNIKEIEHVFK